MALTEVANKTFTSAVVDMDGKRFMGCKFTDCTLRYAGGKCEWDNNTGFVSCAWKFEDAARRTASLFMLGKDTSQFTFARQHFSLD